MADVTVRYSSLEEAVDAYNSYVDELEDVTNKFEEKAKGISSDGEVLGGTIGGYAAIVIAGLRNKINALRSVTNTDSQKVDAVTGIFQNAENEVVNLTNDTYS